MSHLFARPVPTSFDEEPFVQDESMIVTVCVIFFDRQASFEKSSLFD